MYLLAAIPLRYPRNQDEASFGECIPQRFKKGYQGQRKIRPKATRVIQVPIGKVCPKHDELLRPTERIAKRLIIDLILAKKGIRKTITECVGLQGYCSKCN